MMKSVELFAGAGGLALGFSEAGFFPAQVIEWDNYACDTIRENQLRELEHVRDWPLCHGDVRAFDYKPFVGKVDLVTGGPPCQPFSLGGKHKAYNDTRDMFPEAVRAVRELKPKAFVFENVRGLVRPMFNNYFNYIILQLEFPEVVRRNAEDWQKHLKRLEEVKTGSKYSDIRYNVVNRVLNAANYGVPQRRERVFIVGFREDLKIDWSFPDPTHSEESLLHSQWISGDYWEEHKISRKKRPTCPPRLLKRVERGIEASSLHRWQTVRDAIVDLPKPSARKSSIANHIFQPGAKVYPGHTGSPIDLPAKTLKAGAHGVPGGENMLLNTDGTVRYFTVRESARLQTFPDNFVFHGSWTETMRQLGNAVPVRLAKVIADDIKNHLNG